MSDTVAGDQGYVNWLEEQSMLAGARGVAAHHSASGAKGQSPFGRPDPEAAIAKAPVWFTAYPMSMITPPAQSYLAALGDDALWEAFDELGIRAVHTGPVKQAGGLSGRNPTPTVDGHFDRVSTCIDETFGTEEEFRRLCRVAMSHGGTVIDDIIPGHTGKGADFRLAEMNVGDYPGIYHMVEIPPEDWHLLPEVPLGEDATNLCVEEEQQLEKAGYIVGRLQRVIFSEPGTKETNWSATAAVTGADGTTRRWVYLHYFKAGQPSIDWLDPSFAGMRLVIGDALHSLDHLGSGALRLDANGFLAVEKSLDSAIPAWSEGHPLSDAVNQMIASMVRKVGGFTFQELNLSIDEIKNTSQRGADLSYDFVNRPAYIHALATGDTEFMRLTMNVALGQGLQPISLVHALQNHDEMTYELVHFASAHSAELFTFAGEEMTGEELAVTIRSDLIRRLTGDAAPYNCTFTTNGIAATTATLIAASLGLADLSELTPLDVEQIKRAHLLLAKFNAWQPGVFALSGWDLTGSLTLAPEQVTDLVQSGDTRWINRPAYDLMDYRPGASASLSHLPRGASLYGPLVRQLQDDGSFAAQLRDVLATRDECGIAIGTQVDVPPVPDRAMLVLVHVLSEARVQVTALNFSTRSVTGRVRSDHLTPGSAVWDMSSSRQVASVDDSSGFELTLGPHEGLSLILSR